MWGKCAEIAQNAGYPNWFYDPDNENENLDIWKPFITFLWKPFTFFWKPSISVPPTKKITFGEWVHFGIETFFTPFRDQLIPPTDWTGIETSDLESDTVAQKCPGHYSVFIAGAIIAIFLFLIFYF
ncbi:MAG: hypothetical protein LBC02_01365 [Planctomycetaceae bacterium]|jgi:hypothetical protein|nr:hypothetical protein [Planctomycetaceae bacterium]